MPDLEDMNLGGAIIDRVEDTVGAHGNPEESVLPRELLGPMGPRFAPEGTDALDKPLPILLLANRFELLRGTRLDQDPIACHAA